VDPERPGFEHVIVHPRPGGGLTFATAEYPSMRGRIVSSWQIEEGMFTLQVTIPANTTAAIHIPASGIMDITEGDGQLQDMEGITSFHMEDRHAVVEVGSGTYEFRAPMPASPAGEGDRIPLDP
jgi:alpha-L-rhamnosidase